jgi:hypothetical protein
MTLGSNFYLVVFVNLAFLHQIGLLSIGAQLAQSSKLLILQYYYLKTRLWKYIQKNLFS